jgi:hypothetical protein
MKKILSVLQAEAFPKTVLKDAAEETKIPATFLPFAPYSKVDLSNFRIGMIHNSHSSETPDSTLEIINRCRTLILENIRACTPLRLVMIDEYILDIDDVLHQNLLARLSKLSRAHNVRFILAPSGTHFTKTKTEKPPEPSRLKSIFTCSPSSTASETEETYSAIRDSPLWGEIKSQLSTQETTMLDIEFESKLNQPHSICEDTEEIDSLGIYIEGPNVFVFPKLRRQGIHHLIPNTNLAVTVCSELGYVHDDLGADLPNHHPTSRIPDEVELILNPSAEGDEPCLSALNMMHYGEAKAADEALSRVKKDHGVAFGCYFSGNYGTKVQKTPVVRSDSLKTSGFLHIRPEFATSTMSQGLDTTTLHVRHSEKTEGILVPTTST